MICAGIDDVDLARELPGETISTVLLLDVLEHLYDPWRAMLQRIRGWLTAGTRVIASVPNIRNLATLSDIAGGRFEYEPNGVLDITHVRFFTRSTLRDLFEQTGFDVRKARAAHPAGDRRSRDRQSPARSRRNALAQHRRTSHSRISKTSTRCSMSSTHARRMRPSNGGR